VFTRCLTKLVATSCLNQIIVRQASGLEITDVVQTSHPSSIECFDVAELSLDMVSFSSLVLEGVLVSNRLVVHGLQDQAYLNGLDLKVTEEMGSRVKNMMAIQTKGAMHLKWTEYWSCDPKNLEIQSFLNTISLTPQGDALTLGGNEFFSIWARDSNMSAHSYSQHLYFAKEVPKDLYAHSIETKPDLGQII